MLRFLLLFFLPLISAQFNLTYPPSRGFNRGTASQFPCGGFNTVSTTRELWSAVEAPIQLTLEDNTSNIQVLLALGDDPGDAFNTVIVPTFFEQGSGMFCIRADTEGLAIREGQNATVQVITNGDQSGVIYQCADIHSSTTSMGRWILHYCQNSTDVKFETSSCAPSINANETTPESCASGAASNGTSSQFAISSASSYPSTATSQSGAVTSQAGMATSQATIVTPAAATGSGTAAATTTPAVFTGLAAQAPSVGKCVVGAVGLAGGSALL